MSEVKHVLTPNLVTSTHTQTETQPANTQTTDWLSQARVVCLDCGWEGPAFLMLAQACPVCDGRCADLYESKYARSDSEG